MKILYVITSTDVGGAEQALLSLVRDLSPLHTIKVISLKPFGALAKKMEEAGAEEVISLNMTGMGVGIITAISNEIRDFQPDIVHAMLFRAIQFCRCACAGKPCKLITTLHFDLSKKIFFLRWLDRFLKVIDKVTVAESMTTKDFLIQSQKYPSDKVHYIANSPQKDAFFPDVILRKKMRAKYGYLPKNVVFICVARLAEVKQPMMVLNAFYKVFKNDENIRLVWVGDGEEHNRAAAFIEKNKLKKVILLAGEQENINAWLNMADVFVLASKEELLPIALLEAVQVGKPCLVTRVGDMPLWVEQSNTGCVFPPGYETLLCCFMAALAEKAETRRSMSKKMLKTAERITDTSQQYQQLYQQI